jgi:hypothetical protein
MAGAGFASSIVYLSVGGVNFIVMSVWTLTAKSRDPPTSERPLHQFCPHLGEADARFLVGDVAVSLYIHVTHIELSSKGTFLEDSSSA